MADDIKLVQDYLDREGLKTYDSLIKKYINQRLYENELFDSELHIRIEGLRERMDNVEDTLDILQGDGDGSIKKMISDEIDSLVDGAPEDLDTLKEIADWIKNDEAGTEALVERVTVIEHKYESIGSVDNLPIKALFLETITVQPGEDVANVIANLDGTKILQLEKDSIVNGDISVPEGAIIDANGAEFKGHLYVNKNSFIDNAIFSGEVSLID